MCVTIENHNRNIWWVKWVYAKAVCIQQNMENHIVIILRMITHDNVCIPNNAKIQISSLVTRCKGKTRGA